MKMLGLVTRRKMVPFQAGAWREGGCGGAGSGGHLEGAEGRRSGSSTWRFQEAGTELRGRGLGWTPRWSHYLGKARGVLGGVRISGEGGGKGPCVARRAWQQETKEMEKERSGKGREGRDSPQLSEHAQYHVGSGMLSTFSASVAKRTPLVIRAVPTGGRNRFGD